jgi:hypothetical protein
MPGNGAVRVPGSVRTFADVGAERRQRSSPTPKACSSTIAVIRVNGNAAVDAAPLGVFRENDER